MEIMPYLKSASAAKRWRKSPSRTLATACSIIAIGILVSNNAFAQAKIEQMIVTATKRAQDIQAVPASISAFSGDALESRQVSSVQDLTAATPNITWQSVSGVPQLSIRGVSPDGFAASTDPAVALHIDGVYQPRVGSMMSLVLSDLESVEVLRGPQGTLYGRNANAGVINLNTKKPTDTFEGSGTIFGGSYARYGAKGYVSGPITDGISARVSAMVDRSEGWGTNLTNGHDVDGKWAYGGRIAVRLKPTDDVTVDLSASHSYEHNSNPYYAFSKLRGPNYDNVIAAGKDARYTLEPWKVYNTFDPEWNIVSDLATATIAWDINPDMSLKSITGVQHYHQAPSIDIDQMPVDENNSFSPGDSHTFSQEFNFSAKFFDRLDTVAGLYYLRDVYRGGVDVYLVQGSPFGNPANQNFYIHYYLYPQVSSSKAAFFDATLSITDQLRLVGGIRRTLDHRYTVQDAYTKIGGPNGTFASGCRNLVQPDLDYHSTTGKLGLQYDITPEIMAYVSWQNGFKTGGYNPAVCGNSYKPENIYSWEGGIKSTLFNDSVTLNLAVFSYRYSNMQLNRTTFATAVIDNAASSKIKGAEIEGVAYITDNLKLDLGVGILDSEYGPLQARNAAVPGNPLVDLTGNQLPRAPDLTVNAGLEHTMRIGDFGELMSRGEMSYSSRIYYTAFNEPIAKQDPYFVFNAIFTFTPDCSPLTMRAYVRNIFDKAYSQGIATSGQLQYGRGNWAPPRTFGAEVTAKF